ncbi:MAG: hypothetical protein ACK4MU_09305, partial [Thermomonas sp.]
MPFPAGTYDWRCESRVFPLKGPVKQFVVGPLLRNREAQRVRFDHLRLVPIPRAKLCPAGVFGDPHVL